MLGKRELLGGTWMKVCFIYAGSCFTLFETKSCRLRWQCARYGAPPLLICIAFECSSFGMCVELSWNERGNVVAIRRRLKLISWG